MRSTALFWLVAFVFACGGGDDGGSAIDGPRADGPPLGGDGPPMIDSPPGMGPDGAVGVMCGATPCTTTQECCITTGGAMCVDTGTCTGVTFECDGPEDCPDAGQVCCLGGGGPGGGGGSECRNANQCQTPACHNVADCDGEMCCDLPAGDIDVCAPQCPQ